MRATCSGCGVPFPDGPRGTAAGEHWPATGYCCDQCFAELYKGRAPAPGRSVSAEREPFSFSADWEAMWRHALDDEQAEHPEMAPEEVELLLEEKFRAAKAEMKAEEQMHETAYALLEQVWPEDDAPGLVAQ